MIHWKITRLMIWCLFTASLCQAQPALEEQVIAATEKGDQKAVADYLAKGAPINSKNKAGECLLTIACKKGLDSMVYLLLGRGADVNCRDERGRTPKLAATAFSHKVIADSLSARGAKGYGVSPCDYNYYGLRVGMPSYKVEEIVGTFPISLASLGNDNKPLTVKAGSGTFVLQKGPDPALIDQKKGGELTTEQLVELLKPNQPLRLMEWQLNNCNGIYSKTNTRLENSAEDKQPAPSNSAGAKAAGQAFLAENKKRPEVITTASGFQYEVMKTGPGKISPKLTDKVEVHYHGTLIDGTVFDSSVQRGKSFTFGLNQVIKGWTEGLQLMKEGDKFKFFIPAELAYGDKSPSPKIPAGSTLVFEVELLKINP